MRCHLEDRGEKPLGTASHRTQTQYHIGQSDRRIGNTLPYFRISGRSRARNWNSAGMRIRPPRSPEPSASGASKWAGVDDGRLPCAAAPP